MRPLLVLSLLALLLTPVLVNAAAAPAVPAYRWGEELRAVDPAQVTAGSYSLAGNLQVAAPGDVAATDYALYANSVGIERSQAPSPAGPYLVFVPVIRK